MTVNSKNNKIVLLIISIDILLSILYAIKRVNYFYINIHILYSLTVISEIAFLISLLYLRALLKFNNEKKFITNSFYISIIASIVVSIASLNIFGAPIDYYIFAISNLIGVLSLIYTIVVIFFIKNALLSTLFKVYAFASILTFIIDLGMPIILPLVDNKNYYEIIRYIGFLNLLPLLSIFYIFYNSGKIILSENNNTN